MNKPYFTKYIPVPGEIKVGDYYLRGTLINQRLMEEDWKTYPPEWKKVKLFLCSRDIQVGDKFLFRLGVHPSYPWIEGECDEVTEKHVRVIDNGTGCLWIQRANNKEYLKVIGEVSPAALAFVKENMEFDHDDIEFNPLRIKCPCCKLFA